MEHDWHLLIQTVLDENCIALFRGDECVTAIAHDSDFQSDNTFVYDIQRCLLDQHLEAKSIRSLSILKGPGFFTGIRAGIVIAKAWMDVFSIPVRLVSTFAYVKHDLPVNDKKSVIVIRASKIDGYFGFYDKQELVREQCLKLDMVSAYQAEWTVYTPSSALKSISGIHFLSPLPHIPKSYDEINDVDEILPEYGRSLEELFHIP